MAHSPRGWTGARTPSALKRVRQADRRRAINQPRRSAAKTLVAKALVTTTTDTSPDEVEQAVRRAVSALDLAAKSGAIHPNAAARRKSRLMLKVNAALEGAELIATGKAGRSTGKGAAAAKQAKARIAASKASKAKGAQTAAGKARAALARSTRDSTAAESKAAPEESAPKPATRTRSSATSRKAATAPGGEPTRTRSTRAKKTEPEG